MSKRRHTAVATGHKSAGAFVHGSSNDRDTALTQVSYQATSTPSNP